MLTPALLSLLLLGAAGTETAAAPLTTAQVLESAAASEWVKIDPEHLVVMRLGGKQILIELAPAFAPEHSANIRQLVREHYFDGLAILRSQDNYVVQWGDPAADSDQARGLGKARSHLPAEFARAAKDLPWLALPDPDAYAEHTGFSLGFPVGAAGDQRWLLHCYGMLGAGRGGPADSSTGAELYVVIGHSPRHLDRNITLVGRVIEGMEHLSSLPRGHGPLGFYERPEQRLPIESIRLAADLPEEARPRRERLSTESAAFRQLIEARRFRREDWFIDPVGHVEVCNVPLPVREAR